MTTIRQANVHDSEAIAQVHVASWQTTYRGIFPDKVLARLSAEQRVEMWRDSLTHADERGTYHYVAQDTEAIVGFVVGGRPQEDSPYASELYAIYLLETHQRRGIGRQLTRKVVESLLKAGHTSMLVWVIAVSPFRAFYESLGGELVDEKPYRFAGADYKAVAYAWPDMYVLVDDD